MFIATMKKATRCSWTPPRARTLSRKTTSSCATWAARPPSSPDRALKCWGAQPLRTLFLFEVGLVDLDVGLRLEARNVGIEHLPTQLLTDAPVERGDPSCIRRRRGDDLRHLVDRISAALSRRAQIAGQLGRIDMEYSDQRICRETRLHLIARQRHRLAEHKAGVLTCRQLRKFVLAGRLGQVVRRLHFQLFANGPLDVVKGTRRRGFVLDHARRGERVGADLDGLGIALGLQRFRTEYRLRELRVALA